MASKKRRTTYKRKARKNPTKRRSSYKRAASRARSTFSGLNIKGALKNQLPMMAGMLGAKWAAKRFGEAATETDPGSWNYMSYIKAAIGAIGAAVVAQNIKPGCGQKVLEGGLLYTGFKLLENEVISQNEWATEQFGAEEYFPSEYLSGDDDGYQPGDVASNAAGTPYLLGADYEWQELPESGMAGQDALKPINRLGNYPSVLERVGPLGEAGDDNEYRKALLDA